MTDDKNTPAQGDWEATFIDAVEKLAFEMPAPNTYTPRLVQMCQQARSNLRALRAAARAVGDYVLVPREPTRQMCVEAFNAWRQASGSEFEAMGVAYRAMLSASPAPTQPAQDVERVPRQDRVRNPRRNLQGVTLMSQYHHDTTWEVKTIDGSQVVVELDVRVHYDFESVSKVVSVRDVKALFRKHGKLIELDIPEELRVLAIKHFDASEEFSQAIYEHRKAMAYDDAADAKGDHIRERRESSHD